MNLEAVVKYTPLLFKSNGCSIHTKANACFNLTPVVITFPCFYNRRNFEQMLACFSLFMHTIQHQKLNVCSDI